MLTLRQCRTLNSIAHRASKKFLFKDVANYPEDGQNDSKPDLALYRNDPRCKEVIGRDINKKSIKYIARRPYIARAAWAWMVSVGEVKTAEKHAGYLFESGGLFNNSDEGKRARAQFAKYAAEIMTRQHRTHLFTFYISGTYARLFYWDRSGCVVTTPIDLVRDPRPFYLFIFRLVHGKPDIQGYDPSVVDASAAEIDAWRRYSTTNKYLQKYRDRALEDESKFPVYRVRIRIYPNPSFSDTLHSPTRRT